MDEKLEKAFLLSTREDASFSATYLTLKAQLVRLTSDGKPRNMTSLSRWDADFGLSDFVITAQNSGDHDRLGRPAYAWSFGIEGVGAIPSEQVIAAGKVMATVQRKLDKVIEKFGQPSDFGTYAMWVADVLGVSRFVIQTDKPLYGTYDTGGYDITSLGRGADWLREQDDAFRARNGRVSVP